MKTREWNNICYVFVNDEGKFATQFRFGGGWNPAFTNNIDEAVLCSGIEEEENLIKEWIKKDTGKDVKKVKILIETVETRTRTIL